jgi:menaquinone-dependent protoporphyrinogen oxidase
MNTLIVYSSKYGCTEKCAKMLSDELKDKVDLINLKNVKDINPSTYDKVIIGGSIYIGKIQKEVKEFCSQHLDVLQNKHIGLFICGMQEGDVSETINVNFPQELLKIAEAKENFGGEFDFHKMNFMEKMIIKKISKESANKSNILEDSIQRFAQIMNTI